MDSNNICKLAIKIAMAEDDEKNRLIKMGKEKGNKICIGKVGTMNAEKIFSAVMTATKREEMWDTNSFHQEHSLYDAILEALSGICRGQIALSNILRTVGLNFAVVRGALNDHPGEWIAVCFYGTIGAPIKGFEHDTIGLGVNHI